MPRGPVIVWREAIRDSTLLSPNARLTAYTISTYMHVDGTGAYPSLETLVARTRRSRKRVLAAIAELEREGYLSVEHGGGRGHPNRYAARVPEAAPRERLLVTTETVADRGWNGAVRAA